MTNKFCGSMSLKTGGVFIGVISLFIKLSELIWMVDENQMALVSPIYVEIFSSLLLIVGASKGNHLLLTPWMFITMVGFIIEATIFLILGFLELTNDYKETNDYIIKPQPEEIWLSLLVMLISQGFFFYAWLAIYSLFKQLKAQNLLKNQNESQHNVIYTQFHN